MRFESAGEMGMASVLDVDWVKASEKPVFPVKTAISTMSGK